MSATDSPARSSARAAALRELRLDAGTASLAASFRAEGVDALLLKGASFAQWLYADGEPRPYVDIDLLVRPEHFERAEALLARSGFRDRLAGAAPSELWNAHEWLSADGVGVDLHRSFHWMRAPDEAVWRALSEPSDVVIVGGVELRVPGEAARCLLIALHAAHHGRAVGSPLRDLERACALVGETRWREAAAIAQRLDVVEALATGLRMCPDGARLAERLGLPAGASAELLIRAESGSRIAWNIERFATLHGARARAGFVARKLFPTPAFMRHRYAIPEESRGRLVVAYARRQAEMLAGVGPSARTWWRIRRRAKR